MLNVYVILTPLRYGGLELHTHLTYQNFKKISLANNRFFVEKPR